MFDLIELMIDSAVWQEREINFSEARNKNTAVTANLLGLQLNRRLSRRDMSQDPSQIRDRTPIRCDSTMFTSSSSNMFF